jgi:hypothetical protein
VRDCGCELSALAIESRALVFGGLETGRKQVYVLAEAGDLVLTRGVQPSAKVAAGQQADACGYLFDASSYSRGNPEAEEGRDHGAEDDEGQQDFEVMRGRNEHELRNDDYVEEGDSSGDCATEERSHSQGQAEEAIGDAQGDPAKACGRDSGQREIAGESAQLVARRSHQDLYQ